MIDALIGSIKTTIQIWWLKRDKKFGESDEEWVQRKWEEKENGQILDAYEDARGWIRLYMNCDNYTLKQIAISCQERLDKYILPQMKKRGL